jgi:hypothetical protein
VSERDISDLLVLAWFTASTVRTALEVFATATLSMTVLNQRPITGRIAHFDDRILFSTADGLGERALLGDDLLFGSEDIVCNPSS